MKILVSGADGFIGRNLCQRLTEVGHEALKVTRRTNDVDLRKKIASADAVVHLAGSNRPEDPNEFAEINDKFTAHICALLQERENPIPVIASSSIQVERDTPYAVSKRAGEGHLFALGQKDGWSVNICRLTNVFGKWCKPNYNSAVATFCHNIARDLPINVNDPETVLRLVHVDDVIDNWLMWLQSPVVGAHATAIEPEYQITLGELVTLLESYKNIRTSNTVGETGVGLGRALYSTYLSYVPTQAFAYPLTRHGDERGVFAEMLRTEHSGQMSFFTAGPGVTRGGHYHHVKTEKFLVVKGRARFRFFDLNTGAHHVIETTAEESMVVETVPGWSHDITNIGDEELICMLWANELFDSSKPDTFSHPLN